MIKKIRIGDAVAWVAQPIAERIDRVAKTNIRNCLSCKRRIEKLNSLTQGKFKKTTNTT